MKQFVVKTLLVLATLAMALEICGCIKSEITGFTDRDYDKYYIQRIVVRSTSGDFQKDQQIEDTLVRMFRRVGVPSDPFLSRYPPTREWSISDVSKDLIVANFDTIMYVNLISENQSSKIIGYQVDGQGSIYGTATTLGNSTTYQGSTNYNSTTTVLRRVSRYTAIRITIYDVKTAKVIWIGDCKTNSSGALFVGDQMQLNSFTQMLKRTLQTEQHLYSDL
jgi:hypothetical protein